MVGLNFFTQQKILQYGGLGVDSTVNPIKPVSVGGGIGNVDLMPDSPSSSPSDPNAIPQSTTVPPISVPVWSATPVAAATTSSPWKAIAIFGLLFWGLMAFGQSDNSLHVKVYPGKTVGAKIAAAQEACPSEGPCILILDATLSAFPDGTWPTLCANCSIIDYRNGAPTSGISVANKMATNGTANQVWGMDGSGTTQGWRDPFATFISPNGTADQVWSMDPTGELQEWRNPSASQLMTNGTANQVWSMDPTGTTQEWRSLSIPTGTDAYGQITGCTFPNDGGGLFCTVGSIAWSPAFADTSYTVSCVFAFSTSIAGGSSKQPVLIYAYTNTDASHSTITEGVAQGSSGGYTVSPSYGATILCHAHHS